MTAPVVIGVGQTRFGRLGPISLIDLAAEAAEAAMGDCGVALADIEGLFFGSMAPLALGGQAFPAAILAAQLGIESVPALATEGACASGSLALAGAAHAVQSGEMDVALVVGAEKMTDRSTPEVTEVLARVNDVRSESYRLGLTFPGFFALVAHSYLSHYDVEVERLSDIVVKNRANGVTNPHAHFQQAVSHRDARTARRIADPLGLFDCSPISDGAAALIVASRRWSDAHGVTDAVEVMAVGQAGGSVRPEAMASFLSFPAARLATENALRQSSLRHAEIDVIEVHDCFSIAEWIAIEDMGFVPPGQAAAATADGFTSLDGDLPVNPSGGLLSKGHPIGATGVGQVAELARQLRGTAPNAIEGAEIGLAHNIGGTGGVAVVTAMRRVR